jgi:hypothetical protein
MRVFEKVIVVGELPAAAVGVPALLDAHGAGSDELAEGSIDAVDRAAETLGERPAAGEVLRLLIRVPGQEGEQPDGAVRDVGVQEPGGDAPEGVPEDAAAHRLVRDENLCGVASLEGAGVETGPAGVRTRRPRGIGLGERRGRPGVRAAPSARGTSEGIRCAP